MVYHVHKNQMRANTACTGGRGFVAVFKHFGSRGFEFILLPIIVHVRPAASNANRYAPQLRADNRNLFTCERS